MVEKDITFWLSVFGAAISFILACIKIYEFASARLLRLKVSTNLTSSDEIGSTLTLVNASSVAAHIGYHDLAWVQPYSVFGLKVPWLGKVTDEIQVIEEPWEASVDTLPPNGSTEFSYTHAFNPYGDGQIAQRRLYLRLYMVGDKRPTWIRIAQSEDWT